MIFQGRFEKDRKLLQQRMQGRKLAADEDDLENQLEKGDTLAMILSALMVFLPAALIVLAVISLIGYFFIVR